MGNPNLGDNLDPQTLRINGEQIICKDDVCNDLSALAIRASSLDNKSGISVGLDVGMEKLKDPRQLELDAENLDYLQEVTKSGLWNWDSKTGTRTYNTRYAMLAGYSDEDIEKFNANTWKYLVHPDDEPDSKKLFDRCVEGGIDEYTNEMRIRCKDGSWIWVSEHAIANQRDNDGSALQITGLIIDISEIKRLKLKVETLTDIDELTGLNNYYYYKLQFERLDNSRRKTPVSIIDIEIDNMNITDITYGDAAGDKLRIQLAEILNREFRLSDCVARIGENDFKILIPDMDEDAAISTVERIRNRVDEHNIEFPDMPISISIGTATSSLGESLKVAADQADVRSYEEKIAKKKKRK